MRAVNVIRVVAGAVAAVSVYLLVAGSGASTSPSPVMIPSTTAPGTAVEITPGDRSPIGDLEGVDTPSDIGPDEAVDAPAENGADPSAAPAPDTDIDEEADADGGSTGGRPSAAFPDVNPVSIDGAETTFYMPENEMQAGVMGIDPGRVRSWGMRMHPTGDGDADHRRIISGVQASGVVVEADTLEGSATGFGVIYGTYEGWPVELVVGNWTSMTVTLFAL